MNLSNLKFASCVFSVFGVLLAGCDFNFPSLRTATEKVAAYSEEVQLPKETPARPAVHADNVRAELLHFVSAETKIIEANLDQANKAIKEIESDKESMSKAVSELTSRVFSEKNAKKEDLVLAMLKDGKINALALKYLKTDFSLTLAEYISKVRAAYSLQNKKDQELVNNRRQFDTETARIYERDRINLDNVRNEIGALQKKIAEAERRIRFLRKETMLSDKNRKDRDKEISDAAADVNVWQARIAALRVEQNSSKKRNDSKQVYDRFEKNKKEIEKRYAKMESVLDIANEYGKLSVDRLQAELLKAEDEKRKQINLLAKQKLHIKSLSSGLDNLNTAALEKVRGEVEKILSWNREDNESGGENVGTR
jgi:hypothetical protein